MITWSLRFRLTFTLSWLSQNGRQEYEQCTLGTYSYMLMQKEMKILADRRWDVCRPLEDLARCKFR
jgi:hypothetical protein